MRKEDLEKLPADVKKEFMKYAIKLAEKKSNPLPTMTSSLLSNTYGLNL